MTRRFAPQLVSLAAVAALAVACASTNPADPWQGVNRPVFKFNTGVDDYVLRPVSRGWTFITPQAVRDAVARFFFNAHFPSRFVSSVGQGDATKAVTEVGRFLVNTTVGIAGFFDPATHIGLERYDEDIGQMFGHWGIPPGPYWVVPLIGPSDPRDAVGLVCDALLNPLAWVPLVWVSYATGALNVVNARAQADKQIENAKRTALDDYVFVRDAYVQHREHAVRDAGTTAGSGTYDLYDTEGDSGVYDAPEEPSKNAPSP